MKNRDNYDSYTGKGTLRSGIVHKDNLSKSQGGPDVSTLFSCGFTESFNGYSGVTEFESFPMRQIFLNRHKRLPSEFDTGYLTSETVHKFISDHHKKIIATHYKKNTSIKRCLIYIGGKEHIYVILYDRGWDSDNDKFAVCLLFLNKTAAVEKLMDYFNSRVIKEDDEDKGYLNILVKNTYGYSLQQKQITCPDIDFSIHYNQDFNIIHELIKTNLSINNSKGLVLLHGVAGTGKTTYIRYLINNLNKRIIYIPPAMTNFISDPELIKFFITNSNSILVIEDAENVLIKRTAGSSQAIANILNLTDGLLSDVSNIQIVATFNTDIINIDSALLRKGRLIAKYEFKALQKDRVEALAKKLGVDILGEHVLSDIFNAADKSFTEKTNIIGFK